MRFPFASLFSKGSPVVPLVRLSGAIGMSMPFRGSLSLAGLEKTLERAFAIKSAPAVAILINSPGGSAVQSHLIYKRIRDLAAEKDKKVIVGVEDVAASGGYMIACAGDHIVVDKSSIVGSIGVVFASFGFPKLLDRIGIERRVHTAGESKDMLDPFKPEKLEDIARLQALQLEVHAAFIDLVKSRRGGLLVNEPDLFSGAFWSGARAVALGLADRTGDLRDVLRERYGEDVIIRPIAAKESFWRRRFGMRGGEGAAISLLGGLVAVVEERLLWNRFGL
jgi:serine protease SohB